MTRSLLPTDLKVAICAGGSGGHLFPAIAVIEELKTRAPDLEVLCLTSQRGVDAAVLQQYGIQQRQLQAVSSTDFKRNPFSAGMQVWSAWKAARQILQEFQPHLVLGCGGYVSIPGIMAAQQLRIPRLLLEQNVVPGRATSLLSRISCGCCVSFSETVAHLPKNACTVWTGNPVRSCMRSAAKQPHFVRDDASKNEQPRTLLVLGGSQGAHALNDVLLQFIKRHSTQLCGWTITHQTGPNDVHSVQQGYTASGILAEVVPFIDDIATAYENADLIITRGGATSLAEIATIGRPMLVVPYPQSIRDHQRLNARWYSERHAAVVVEQNEEFADVFSHQLIELLTQASLRNNLAQRLRELALPNAAAKVVRIIENRLSTSDHLAEAEL